MNSAWLSKMFGKEKELNAQKEEVCVRPVSIGLYEMLSLAQSDSYYEQIGLAEAIVEKAEEDKYQKFESFSKAQ